MGTVLRAIEVPALGGDTLFADMAAAYDNLPEEIQETLEERVAVQRCLCRNAVKCQDHCLLARAGRWRLLSHRSPP